MSSIYFDHLLASDVNLLQGFFLKKDEDSILETRVLYIFLFKMVCPSKLNIKMFFYSGRQFLHKLFVIS